MSDETPSPEPALDEPDLPTIRPVPVFEEEPVEKPRHYVFRDTLVSQTRDGEFRLELDVPYNIARVIEGHTPREQLYRLLRLRGRTFRQRLAGARIARRLDRLDTTDSGDVIRRFWQAYGEREVVRLGESLRSAGS